MANQVIKRDGTKEAFDENKVRKSIEAAGRDANLPAERITAVVNQIAGVALGFAADKEEIATSELAAFILAQLDQVEPAAAAAWRKHDAEKGKV
jgi:transcriptional regulator NrdR family protein